MTNPIEFLTIREKQQRELAERARVRDDIEFHTQLADRYARLLEEARNSISVSVPAIELSPMPSELPAG
jgi:hypothetical protein